MVQTAECYTATAARRMESYAFPNIAHWMNANKMSAFKLAMITGFSAPTISLYLTGQRDPKLTFILDILRVTGMTFEEAFRKKEE